MPNLFSEENLDRIFPHLLALGGIGAYVALYHWFPQYALPKNLKDLLTASATISSIAVGFMATAKATVLSISDSRPVKWLKEAGQFNTLVDYFMTAIHYSMATAILSALMLLFDFQNLPSFAVYFIGSWVFLSIGALSSGYRIIRLYAGILRKC